MTKRELEAKVRELERRLAYVTACQSCGKAMPDHQVADRFKVCDDCADKARAAGVLA